MKHATNILKEAAKPKISKRIRVAGHSVNELRKQAITELFGTSCQLCGTSERRLHLCHLYYDKDSIGAKEEGKHKARQREAISYPERFVLLCLHCHITFDTIQKNGGYKFVDKLNLLIRRAADEAASYLMSAGVFK
jgi:hypothetical protein